MGGTTVSGIEATLRSSVEQFPDTALVVLFGSAANGRMRPDSDVDIAIAGKALFTWERLQEIRRVLSRSIRREVDLVDLNASKGLIFYEALTKGKVIVSKNKRLMARLMTEVVYFAADVLPLRSFLFEQRARRFING